MFKRACDGRKPSVTSRVLKKRLGTHLLKTLTTVIDP
jgi:hypothetical protein